ncbi:MAG: hypothetical protein Q8R39_01590 [bacterium]|nr:hypothetical protein [bacterium]
MGDRKIWALGYATSHGMRIISNQGDKLSLKVARYGNMYMPDDDEFEEKFLPLLGRDDIVLSSCSSNTDYHSSIFARCRLDWVPGNALTHAFGTKVVRPEQLLELHAKDPGCFYEYLPTDQGIGELRYLVFDWLNIGKQVVRDGNSLSHSLRRLARLRHYFRPDISDWAKRFAKLVVRRFKQRLKTWGGIEIGREEGRVVEDRVIAKSTELYERYFGAQGKEANAARLEFIKDRFDYFGIQDLSDHTEAEVERRLKTLPEYKLFDGLIGEAPRTRALVLTYLRNPLLYPNAAALVGYSGLVTKNGQAVQRRRGELSRGNPSFRQALVFDFADKYANIDPIGVFKGVYYAYKAHQYSAYWPLITLTQDIFAHFNLGGNSDEDEVDEREQEAALEEALTGSRPNVIREFSNRLWMMADDLLMVQKNPAIQDALLALMEDPENPKRLWHILARGNVKGYGLGLNLQMPRLRVENQAKRMMGTVLVVAVYYRWLKLLGAPLPLCNDRIYMGQYRYATGDPKAKPSDYDPTIVTRFYKMRAEEIRAANGVVFPPDVALKLVLPEERPVYLMKADDEFFCASLAGITPPERGKEFDRLLGTHASVEHLSTRMARLEERHVERLLKGVPAETRKVMQELLLPAARGALAAR